MLVAAQMLTGSACLGLLAVLTGEPAALDVQAISVRSWASLAYLITAGALVGYCAYIWLLTVSTPARVGTYAYVNPVVALWLGWWLADEVLTFRSLAAAFIILVSVIVITAPSSGLGGRIRKRSPRLTGESG
jgi:drug/metabolite transporter (DMT)-like permease